ncbi:DUF4157 domain-containing protein [Actinoplanes sp. NPDC049599]|uniref:DUF4157 domain-containing protein n=1 Tax=Actinoplanes sp. NPDC049599 TaxID=3363903 RepID=UPI0037BE0D39
MRAHDHDSYTDAGLRPRGDRADPAREDLTYQAAATGRPETLGAAGLLDLQRTVGNAGVGAMLEESPVHGVVGAGGGAPLDADTRADMESRLGHDFGDVRVHTDQAAHDSAKAMNAQAYTVGSSVVFQRDRYDPASADGKLMLAHELTHVVQQRHGPVDGTDAGGGVRVSDPSDRFERAAVANAERAMAQPATAQRTAEQHSPAAGGTTAVQRDAAPPEEEEASAQTFVQRQEEEPAS